MKLWRVLALPAAAFACATATASPANAAATDYGRDAGAASDHGLLSLLSHELQRSSALVQRFFFDSAAPEAVQLIIIDDSVDGDGDALSALTLQQQKLACQTAVQVFREQDALEQERQQLSHRLRSPFKRAFQVMSLHYFDEASCDDLEDSHLVAGCNQLVEAEDAVRQFMVHGRSDAQVCALVIAHSQDTSLPTLSPPTQDDLPCKLCKRFVKMIDEALAQEVSQIQVVREIIGDICDSMAPDSMCHTFLNDFDEIVQWLKEGSSPDTVCARTMMCSAQTPVAEPLDLSARGSSGVNGHACSYCAHITYVVAKVNKVSPDHLNFARKLIEWGCKLAPKDCKCDVLVTNYDKIVAWVKQGKTPREICEALKLCTSENIATADAFALGEPDRSIDEAFAALMPLVHVVGANAAVQDAKTCFYCDYATTLLQIALQEQADLVNEVREYADLICGILGPDSACHAYVVKFDTVVDELKSGKHPHEICAAMKYCNATAPAPFASVADSVANDLVVLDQHLVKAVKSSMESAIDSCFVCTQLASIIEVAIQEDPSQIEQIRQIGDLVCDLLPSKSKCHPVMNELDTVIDSLKKGETPKAICHDLKFCKASNVRSNAHTSSPPRLPAPHAANTSCAYCSGVVTVLEVALKQKPDEVKEAREAAGIVCRLLPADDKCHNDLKLFDSAVAQLKSGKQPHEICQSLKFCSSDDDAAAVTLSDLAVVDPSLAPSRCTVCMQNSLLLASMVTEPSRLATFTDEMNSICRLIPDSKECELLLKHHDTIVDALQHNEDVPSICTRIHECGVASEAAPPVETSMSMSCLLCEYTAELVKHASKHQNELRLAKVALETMCTILPPAARCDVLSSKFDDLVVLAQSGKSPSEACHAVALCAAAFVEPLTPDRASYLLQTAAQVGNVAEVE